MSVLPTHDRRSVRRQETRDEIVAAAWELAAVDGLAGLSLRDLAARVGMRAQSLYSYFPSKNAIYDAMYAEGYQAYAEAYASRPQTGDRLTDLQAAMRHFVQFCTSNPVRYQLLFQRTVPGFEPSEESFAIAVDHLEQVRARFVALGMTRPEDLDLWTALCTGLVDQQVSNDPGGQRWSRLVDDAAQMFHDHVTRRAAR